MPRDDGGSEGPVLLTVRERLLEAGYACVARFGLAKTTVEDVAKESGLSRATIYRYFPGGRDDLLRQVVAWEAARFMGRLAEAVAGAPDLASLVTEALRFGRRAIDEHTVLQKVLATEPERLLPLLTVESHHLLDAGRAFLLPYLDREAARGALRPGLDLGFAADYVARMVLSYAASSGSWSVDDPAEAARVVRDHILPGILVTGTM